SHTSGAWAAGPSAEVESSLTAGGGLTNAARPEVSTQTRSVCPPLLFRLATRLIFLVCAASVRSYMYGVQYTERVALHKLPEKGRVLLNRETVAGEFRSKVKHLHRVLKPIVHGLLRNVSGFKAFHQVRAAHAAEEIQSSAFDLQIEAFGNGDSATRAEFRGVPEKVRASGRSERRRASLLSPRSRRRPRAGPHPDRLGDA